MAGMPKPLMCPPELLASDLSGRRLVVTGANAGIGFICAKQLAKQGAEVILACRRPEQGEAAIAKIRAEHSEAKVELRQLDLGDLSSVRAFAEALLADHDTLHGLLNNAGVMNTPQGKTRDGFETQLGVNHLGHFLLTHLLLPALRRGAPSRIVVVSSCFHDKAAGRPGKMDWDDLHFEQREYDGWSAYAQSKLANVLHARALAKRLEGSGVTAVSVHPGWVRTGLGRHTMPLWVQDYLLRPIFRLIGMLEPWEGAQTSLYAMLAPEVEQHPGRFYSQTGVYRDKAYNEGGWPLDGTPNPEVHDANAEQLWVRSADLVGLS